MHHNIYASILVMFLTIYAVRALPLTLIRREIRNPFIQSFLYYVPYVSLSVMPGSTEICSVFPLVPV